MINKPLSEEWFENHVVLKKQKRPPMLNSTVVDFLMPTSMEYDCSVVSTYSSLFPDLNILHSEKQWILRDGMIPLAWFFRKHSNPADLTCKIFIDKKALPLVPKPWRALVGTYELYTRPGDHKRTRLGLLGLLSDNYLSGTYAEKVIRKSSGNFRGYKAKNLRKICHLPTRDPYGPYRPEIAPHAVDMVLQMAKFFGPDIQSLSLNEVVGLNELQNYFFVDINDNLLNSDNGLLHYLLARGAALWKGRTSLKALKESESLLPISKFHGFVLNTEPEYPNPPEPQSPDFETIDSMMELFNEPANMNFPWPDIFSDWTHDILKGIKY